MIAPVEIVYDTGILPMRRHTATALEDTTLLTGNPLGQRLVPPDTVGVKRVVLRYRLRNRTWNGRLVLQG